MAETNPIFENKRERFDFWIAMIVILLFAFFILRFMGCNAELPIEDLTAVVPAVSVVDTDGDGVSDEEDLCPAVAGSVINKGCPGDKDGDGLHDKEDACPNFAGTAELNGCPPDSDGDGIHDGKDKCPKLAGVRANKGCPSDKDGDGIYDVDDACPNKAGNKANNGCPDARIDKEDKAILDLAAKNVEFQTGNAVLKPTSVSNLDKIAVMMNKYKTYALEISGHTDNQGVATKNQQLSERRAQSCVDYLIGKGISASRISAIGIGQNRPIASNKTPEGRQKNRRVEFEFKVR